MLEDLDRVVESVDDGREERRTFLKEKVAEDGISRHLGVDSDDAAPDDLVARVGGEEVIDAVVDVVKAVVYLLDTAPLCEVRDVEVVAYDPDDVVPVAAGQLVEALQRAGLQGGRQSRHLRRRHDRNRL